MGEALSGMKNMHVLENKVTVKSALKEGQEAELEALAQAVWESMA